MTGARLLRAGVTACVALAAAIPVVGAAGAAGVRNGQIYFNTQFRRSNIYAINPNGTGKHLVVRNAAEPSVSADGRKIAFIGPGGLFIANANGSGRRHIDVGMVPDGSLTGPSPPSFSPNGQQLAFDSDQGIFVVNNDGSGLHQVFSNTIRVHGVEPVFSPDGHRILFSERGDLNRICVMNADGSNVQPLRTGRNARDPAFSPSGNIVLFDRGGSIFKMNINGSHLRRLSRPPAGTEDLTPKFSPDGRKIVWEHIDNPGNQNLLWIMNADGSHEHTLTHGTVATVAPAWQAIR